MSETMKTGPVGEQYLITDGEKWVNLGPAPTRNDAMRLAEEAGWFKHDEDDYIRDEVMTGMEAHRVIVLRHQERLLELGMEAHDAGYLVQLLLQDMEAMIKATGMEEYYPVVLQRYQSGDEWKGQSYEKNEWPSNSPVAKRQALS